MRMCIPETGGWRAPTPVVATLLAAVLLGACGGRDGAVVVSGDVPGLDTVALRGERLIANAGTPAAFGDSLILGPNERRTDSASSRIAPAGSGAPGIQPAPAGPDAEQVMANTVGEAMSRRAQARGDSMARAMATQIAGTNAAAERGDSIRGVLEWEGTEPARRLVMRRNGVPIGLTGMPTSAMSKLVGGEVVAYGMAVSTRDFVVSDFVVRGMNGLPAYDGTLEADGALRLTDGSGTKRVPLPSGIRGMAGTRVWIAVRDGQTMAAGLVGR